MTAYEHGTVYTGDDIIINGLTLNTISEDGCRWIVTNLDGWWGLPDPDIPADSRPFYEDGNYLSYGRYLSRNITLEGVIVPGENSSGKPFTVAARNSLNRALTLVRKAGTLRVNESDAAKISDVQLIGRSLTRFSSQNDALEFNFQLRASDPRKYALNESVVVIQSPVTSGSRKYNRSYLWTYSDTQNPSIVTVNNAGSYPTPIRAIIRGPVLNPQLELVATGEFMGLTYNVARDEYVEIDFTTRSVQSSNGLSLKNKLQKGSTWFTLPPGDSVVRFNGIQSPAPRAAAPATTNLFLNPSAETAGSTVTVQTNAILSSSGVGWSSNAAGEVGDGYAIPPFPRSGLITRVSSGTMELRIPAALQANTAYTGRIHIDSPLSVSGISVLLRPDIESTTGQVLIGNITTSASYGEYVVSGMTGSTSMTNPGLVLSWSSGGIGDRVSAIVTLVQSTSTLGPLTTFDGKYSLDTDAEVGWTGDPELSTSTLRYRTVNLTNSSSTSALAVRSTEWKSSGSYSAKILPLSTTNDTYFSFGAESGAVRYGMIPGRRYTVMGKCYIPDYVAGSLHTNAGRIVVYWKSPGDASYSTARSDDADATPGVYPLTLTFDLPSTANEAWIRFYHGGAYFSGSVMWDDMLLAEGDYPFDYFDGNSQAASWTGTPDNSTSFRPAVTEIPRSVIELRYKSAWIE